MVPTPTQLRKTGATAAATALSSGDTLTVARQMAHTPQTAARYYHSVTGKQHAVKAFTIRSKLVNEGSDEDKEEDEQEGEDD